MIQNFKNKFGTPDKTVIAVKKYSFILNIIKNIVINIFNYI